MCDSREFMMESLDDDYCMMSQTKITKKNMTMSDDAKDLDEKCQNWKKCDLNDGSLLTKEAKE